MATLSQDTYLNQSMLLSALGSGSSAISTFSTIHVSSIDVTGELIATYIQSAQISSVFIEAEEIACSSISTLSIVLDGNTLTSVGTELLLNGIPLTTTSSLSSIADWSLDPAISTVNMNGFPFIGAKGYQGDGTVSTTSLVADTAAITRLVCSDISTTTLTVLSTVHVVSTVSSLYEYADAAYFSSVNGAQFPQVIPPQMGVSTITGPDTYMSSSKNYLDTTQATANIVAEGSLGGAINVRANPGYLGTSGGAVNVQAFGGNGAGGAFGAIRLTAYEGTEAGTGNVTGGLIQLQANSGGALSNATSAIKFSGGSVVSYAGAANPVGSLYGYNYVYGTLGVSLTAAVLPPTVNTPGTVYLYGDNGTVVGSDLYASRIYGYWNGIAAPSNVFIAGRQTVLSGNSYVVLSNVQNMYMDTGAISGVNTINGSAYPPPAGDVSTWATFPASCNVNMSNNVLSNASMLTGTAFSTLSGTVASLNVSSVNGALYPPAAGAVADWATFPAIQNVDMSNYTITNAGSVITNSVSTPQILNNDAYITLGMTQGVLNLAASVGNSVNVIVTGSGNPGLLTAREVQIDVLTGYNSSLVFNGNLSIDQNGEILTFADAQGQLVGVSTINGDVYPPASTGGIQSSIANVGGYVEVGPDAGIILQSPNTITLNTNVVVGELGHTLSFLDAQGAIDGLSTINGAPFPAPAADVGQWATFPAVTEVVMDGNNITNVSILSGFEVSTSTGIIADMNVSSLNGSAYPPPTGNVADWATFPAIQNVDIRFNNIMSSAGIYGNVTSIQFGNIEPGALDLKADPSQGVRVLNNDATPGLLVADTVSTLHVVASDVSTTTVYGTSTSIDMGGTLPGQMLLAYNNPLGFVQIVQQGVGAGRLDVAALTSVSSVNGVIYPPPAGSSTDWADYPAVSTVNMAAFDIVNVNSVTALSTLIAPIVSTSNIVGRDASINLGGSDITLYSGGAGRVNVVHGLTAAPGSLSAGNVALSSINSIDILNFQMSSITLKDYVEAPAIYSGTSAIYMGPALNGDIILATSSPSAVVQIKNYFPGYKGTLDVPILQNVSTISGNVTSIQFGSIVPGSLDLTADPSHGVRVLNTNATPGRLDVAALTSVSSVNGLDVNNPYVSSISFPSLNINAGDGIIYTDTGFAIVGNVLSSSPALLFNISSINAPIESISANEFLLNVPNAGASGNQLNMHVSNNEVSINVNTISGSYTPYPLGIRASNVSMSSMTVSSINGKAYTAFITQDSEASLSSLTISSINTGFILSKAAVLSTLIAPDLHGTSYNPPGAFPASVIDSFYRITTANVSTMALNVSSINGIPSNAFVDAYQIYVAPNGNNTIGTGSQQNPYLTIAQAITKRATLSSAIEVSIILSSGTYTESFTLAQNTYLVGIPTGEQNQPCNIIGNVIMSATSGQVGISGLRINGTADSVTTSGAGAVYSIYNIKVTAGAGNAIQLNQGTVYITECRVFSNATASASNPAITIGSGATVILRNSTVSNQATNFSAVMTCNGTLTVRGTVFQSLTTSATAQAIVVFSGSGGKAIEFSNTNITYTSATVDTGGNKCCLQFNNATGTYTVSMVNCLLLCEGAITGTPLVQCIQKPGAGTVTMTYGNLLSGAVANHIAPAITHTPYVVVT